MFANMNPVHVREHGMFANMANLVGVDVPLVFEATGGMGPTAAEEFC